MERKKYIFLITLVFITTVLNGQNSLQIYDAYRISDMEKWKRIIDDMQNNPSKTDAFTLELINFQYGYIAWCIENNNTKEATKYLEMAREHLNSLEEKGYKPSDVYAYKAAFIGYDIAITPRKAPFIGKESLNNANSAIDTDPLNPFGYIQLGNIMQFMPKVFGGSSEKAIEHYKKALELMDSDSPGKDWNLLNLLGSIINAYIETKNYITAKEFCLKSIEIEPNFDWVINELYPKTLKLMEQ